MLFDAYPARSEPPVNYDFIVVGAGTIGLFVAVLLARAGKRVLVLESGGAEFEEAAQQLNEASIVGFPHSGATMGRARVLGGTSTLWGGQLAPFSRVDIATGGVQGKEPWPIAYEELEKYYKKCGEELGLSRYVQEEHAIWRKLGVTIPAHPSLEVFVTHWLNEPNMARKFRREIAESPNLHVVLHTQAVDLPWNAVEGKVAGVSVRCALNGTLHTVHGDTIILANGTIEISRLLLFTGKDPAVPWASSRWVGRCFQDHIDLNLAWVTKFDEAKFNRLFGNILLEGHKFQPKLRFSNEFLSRSGLLNVACSFVFQSDFAQDIQHLKTLVKSVLRRQWNLFRPRETLRHLRGLSRVWFPLVYRYLMYRRIFSPADKGISVTLHCEHAPSVESCVGLDEDACDRFGIPHAMINWQFDKRLVAESAAAFCGELATFLTANGLGKLRVDEELRNSDGRILEKGRDTFHQCGGAGMAVRPDDGVVDEYQMVFGTRNLYVAGAAVFPTSSFANPTFTALALGMRMVDHLLGRETDACGSAHA